MVRHSLSMQHEDEGVGDHHVRDDPVWDDGDDFGSVKEGVIPDVLLQQQCLGSIDPDLYSAFHQRFALRMPVVALRGNVQSEWSNTSTD